MTYTDAEIQRILHEVRDSYARFGRGDADIFRVLENRLIPLTPGEPVRFLPNLRHSDVDPAKRRWLNGTYDGPVENPDDPHRSGDVYVLTRSGSRAPVFLSSVQRRSDLTEPDAEIRAAEDAELSRIESSPCNR
jgi:hypothetical protein